MGYESGRKQAGRRSRQMRFRDVTTYSQSIEENSPIIHQKYIALSAKVWYNSTKRPAEVHRSRIRH